ncbi:zinc finger BED domain-containing protein RICESLEEPER 1-like [Cicer arietinum]|uniref:zinc finger BED domain-containing protein RICESLEEPER 1-like n=1 Tax=Cicer arietinum TaxID=3827 RepID=UPI003CC528ED
MAENMLGKFEKYWNVVHEIMGVAVVLGHRYKIELLEYYYVKLYGNDANDQVKSIRQLCYDLLYEYQLKMNNGSSSDSQMLDVHFSNVEGDGLEDYDLYVRRKKKARTSFVKTELDVYLEEEVLPRSPGFDILLWWKLSGVKYPKLQTIAKDVLAIPVSTVASESAFSIGGHILSPH